MSNTNTQFNVDPELFRGFLDDSLESLSTLEPMFVALETNPNDLEVIDDVFRPVHSIKGNAAFFDLIKTKNFAHRLETLLDNIRKKKVTADHKIVELLLLGVDELKAILSRVSDGESEVDDEAKLEALAKKIDSAASGEGLEETVLHLSQQVDKVIVLLSEIKLPENSPDLGHELDELGSLNQLTMKLLNQTEENASNESPEASGGHDSIDYGAEELNGLVNPLNGLLSKPVADVSEDSVKSIETILVDLTKSVDEAAGKIVDAMLEDYRIMMSSAVGYDDLLRDLLSAKMEELKPLLKSTSKSAVAEKPEGKPKEKTESSASSSGRTMRISEEKVDDFMKYVGELIMISDSLNFLEQKLESTNLTKEFHATSVAFRNLSEKLQSSLLEIRKVPARGLTQRIPRMVRDLADKLKKEVKVNIKGEDVSIDKTLLESLGDPVTHMVRNCMDHGLEMPGQREENNKPRAGTINIEIAQVGEEIQFIIEDDGKGIDPEVIRNKAVEKGLASASHAATLNDHQIIQYIMQPGFSTAATISDVSGRGVGMDVVRTNVERECNGTIEISSQVGQGTLIKLHMPANTTVVVVSCLLLGVGDSRFLIPVENIKQLIRVDDSAVSTIQGKGEMVMIREQLYPLVRLHEYYDIPPKHSSVSDGLIVLVESNHEYMALFLDEVFGQQRVVVKDLEGELANMDSIRGAAVLGDNKVGMVVDVSSLVTHHSEQPMAV